ncbi:MAG TPA: DNA/RNA nuclease SfsA [Candidatus Caccovicinus merdipullorum]|uniref:Sugar fermentation stimulation protein homolog n=1 Tax=Candidatus Caccovicinus merdipullorum TaxID=2840724 RepID=A0A9D1GIH9_9FIRM|nr:DNA/RNA nuclease SfsA [Candidatus Caccovicinus merdipullorum]
MQYLHTCSGIFQNRPNRFIANVLIDGHEEVCHVKNTGRCRELLLPGTPVILEHHPEALKKGRRTAWDLIGVYKEPAGFRREKLLINMDSQAPNTAAWEWILGGGFLSHLPPGSLVEDVRREVRFHNSRFDLAFRLNGTQAFMEVKGVTLEQDGIAAFPDAPTQRGVRHLEEMILACKEGFPCFLLLVIQMKGIRRFRPNMETHPAFGFALEKARQAGVRILALDCLVTENSMTLDMPVPVDLSQAQPFPL